MTLDDAIRSLRDLNEPVPKPMRLPTPEEVSQAEKQLGRQFHSDYRRFLLEASDVVVGTYEPATLTIPGAHTDLLEICKSAYDSWKVPKSLLPFCEDNADYFCLNENGEVVFWSHNGTTDEKWPNLATWIEKVWIGGA